MIKHINRCTLCLSFNKRTLNIFRTNLQYVYENLANLKVGSETWMCFICHERLRQCDLLQQLAINTRGLIANNICEVDTKFESLLELSTSNTRIICLPSPCETQYAAAIKTEPDETSEVNLNDTEIKEDKDVETTNDYNEDGQQNPGSFCADSEKNNLICDDDTLKVDRNNSRQTKKELLLIIEKLSPSIIAKFVRSSPEKRRDEHFEEGEFTLTSTKKNKQEIEEVVGDTERRKEKENEPEYINQLEKLNEEISDSISDYFATCSNYTPPRQETSSDDSFHNEFGTSKNSYLMEVNQTSYKSPNEGITHDINNQSQIEDNANHSNQNHNNQSQIEDNANHSNQNHNNQSQIEDNANHSNQNHNNQSQIEDNANHSNQNHNNQSQIEDNANHSNQNHNNQSQIEDNANHSNQNHNNQSQIEDNANHSITIIHRRKPESSNVRDKHYCYYCETFVLNFARHLLRHHIYETEVQKILSKPKKSLDRKQLISALRKKGNYLVNSKEVIKPMRKRKFTDYLPCPECLGFYSKKLLWKHKKKCSGKTGCKNIQSEAQNLLVRHLNIDEKLKDIVFPRMRPDKISLNAKKDILICAFGSQYLKTHREKHFVNVVSRKMRELAKLLIELKKIDPSINDLFAALRPNYYDILVEATKILGKYDIEKDRYETPTLAMNMSTTLKQCCNIAIMFALKKQGPYTEVDTGKIEADLKNLIQLIESNWKYDVSTQNEPVSLLSTKNKTRKGKKRTLVPWTREQKDVVTKYFRFHIKNHKPPKRQECEKLKEQHVDLLDNKDWLKIKVFVQNIYSKKLKKQIL